jgi:uncharacterized protein (TIGR03663 family)
MKFWAALLLALLVAASLRLPQLDRRPLHNDEAVNAVKFSQLWQGGVYRYDPDEHHGPTLHYLAAGFLSLTGAPQHPKLSEAELRSFAVLVGVLLVLLLAGLRPVLGTVPVLGAAVLTALSPAMVFYSRYWIHEGLLLLFSLMLIVAIWRWWLKPSWGWAALAGIAGGLMSATKETFVFNLAATGVGAVMVWSPTLSINSTRRQALLRQGAFALGLGLLVAVMLFTSFGQTPAGLLDAFRTYEPWFSRAAGASPHVNPWSFYLERLFWFHRGREVWSEGFILLLALVAAVNVFRSRTSPSTPLATRFGRFMVGYTLTLLLIYTLIPYKTPWCILGCLHGFIVLAGLGVAVIWGWAGSYRTKAVVASFLLAGCAHLGWQAWCASFRLDSSPSNPWVYAHTSPDLFNLVELVQDVASSGAGFATEIHVITRDGDCWPLPWYLRRFDRVGYWESMPTNAPAPIQITSAGMELPGTFAATHVEAGFFQLRPRVFLQIQVERSLWEKHLKP